MDSHTDRHEAISEQAQQAAQEKEQFNTECRKHVVNIVSQLGVCLRVVSTDNEQVTRGTWATLGHNICDFTEFLDAN